MQLLVTGSRDWTDFKTILQRMSRYPKDTQLIHGGAEGADELSDQAASILGWPKPIVVRPDYKKYFWKVAPLMRNQKMTDMLEAGDEALAFRINVKGGTTDCVNRIRKRPEIKLEEVWG